MATVSRKLWSRIADGTPIYKYTLTNASGASAVVSNIGAAIVSINVPDRNGKLGDVVIGYGKAESYFADGPCAGKCPGRYANRIAGGRLTIAGKEYKLPINNGPNHLHGGPEGFQNKVWESRKRKGGVEFKYVSADGEMGYPGNLVVVARYDWSEDNELRLTFTARTDATTVVNLTNHSYFNLNCKGSGLGQWLTLNAEEYLPTDATLIPTGVLEPVHGTPMDFRKPKTLARDIKKDFPALNYGKGYDACWAVKGYIPGQPQSSGASAPAACSLSPPPSRVSRSIPAITSRAAPWARGAASTMTTTPSPWSASTSRTAPTTRTSPAPCSSPARSSARP